MAAKKKAEPKAPTFGDERTAKRNEWRAMQGIVVDETEPPKPDDAPYVDLPTNARSHPPEA